ncbi:hypothetical protein Tco_0832150 [Tanacetum coccineum]
MEKSLPFCKTLKPGINKSDFAWTEEVEKALKDINHTMFCLIVGISLCPQRSFLLLQVCYFDFSSSTSFFILLAMPKRRVASINCFVLEKEYDEFLVPSDYDYVLLSSGHTALDASPGYLSLYLSLFSVRNFRLPLNKFFLDVLDFFRCHISLLNPFGAIRLSSFVVACRAYGGESTLPLFKSLFTLGSAEDWLTF